MFVSKKIFNKCSINSGHACMMNSKAIGQKILQLQVLRTKKSHKVRPASPWNSSRAKGNLSTGAPITTYSHLLQKCMDLCLYVCLCVAGVWRSEKNPWESVLSLHYVSPWDWTQAISLGNRHHLYMLSHLPSPPITFNLSETVALGAYSPKGIYPAIWTQSPGTSLKSRWPLFTLHCSASVRRTSVEAEPSRRNRPKVSFSRHMSRIALAVFPVSLREWTNTST